tara:strand:+ start:259 stop:984 length:726 start_codon:yes stop_codon:yes gene_type:complete
MPKILRVKDASDKFHKSMPTFDLPFKILINGKSQMSGKTTVVLNLLMNPEFGYDKLFLGENIYIISDNKLDLKLKLLQDFKSIPDANIMSYDESTLEVLYEHLEELFIEERDDKNIQNRVIIFDDVGYSGNLKSKEFGIISKLVANGRHLNLSQIYTSQRFTMVSTTVRANITGAILFSTSARELELISDDFNYLENRKEFVKMFRKYTANPRSFLVVNFTNKDGMYMDTDFKTIREKTTD